jgi:predicted ATPase
LPPSASEVLLLAAVIGRDFDLGILATVSPLAEDEVLGAIDGATTARLVDETGIDGYRFAHALVRSALYRTIGSSRRSRLHRRVAEAIERRRPDDVTALAYHFAEAGEDQRARAVHYAARAGDQAMQRLAHDQAIYFYERGLELAKGLRPDDPSARCELLASLGEAQRNAGVPEYRESLLEAARTAERLGDTPRLVRAALANNRGWASSAGAVDHDRVAMLEAALRALAPDDSAERASLLALLAAELLYAGDRVRRIRLRDDALAMARRVGDPATLAHVLPISPISCCPAGTSDTASSAVPRR